MFALLGKELRQLAPIAWLWLAVIALGTLAALAGSRIDEESFGGWYEQVAAVGADVWLAAVSTLIGLVTAWSLFPREHDDSTIDFLRALPVSRSRIFLAKVLAAWLVVAAVTGLSYGIDAALLASNPSSIDGRFYSQVFWSFLWRDLAFSFVVIAWAVLLSWFRITGLVVWALYLLLVMWLESASGDAGLFSLLRMLSNEYDGSRLVVDSRAILVHVALACVALAIAHRLWRGTDSAAAGGHRPRRGGALPRAVLTAVAFVAVGVALVARVGAPGMPLGGTEAEPAPLEVVQTRYFRFVFAPEKRATVDYVLEHADRDFEALGAMLGVDADAAESPGDAAPTGLPQVRVNLAAASEHAAGLATWKTIRIDLDTFDSDRSQRRVLAHEATHVLQSVLSDRALARHFAAARFFVEGMAQYASFAIVPEPGRRRSNWAIAAVAWQRQDIDFEDLIDPGFAGRFDPDLYYSLGDLWTTSFVDVCGEAALGDFLRAAGRDDVPRALAPDIFWRDTLREIGCELESIGAAWRERMQALHDATDLGRFPRFEDTVVTRLEDGRVRIEANLVADDADDADDAGGTDGAGGTVGTGGAGDARPARFVVRVGAGASLVAAVDPVFRGRVQGGAGDALARLVWEIPARAVPRTRFEYQLGYAPYDDSRVWYDTRRNGAAPPVAASDGR